MGLNNFTRLYHFIIMIIFCSTAAAVGIIIIVYYLTICVFYNYCHQLGLQYMLA